MSLFTIDADVSQLEVGDLDDGFGNHGTRKQQMQRHLRIKKQIKRKALKGRFEIAKLFQADEDIRILTANCLPTAPYRRSWAQAFQSYVNGDWPRAKGEFEAFM